MIKTSLFLIGFLAFCGNVFATNLDSCREIKVDAERLACFDRMVSKTTQDKTSQPSGVWAWIPKNPLGGTKGTGSENLVLVSKIPGEFLGWDKETVFTLDNKQTWRVDESSVGVYRLKDPEIRIETGALGSFFMEIKGVKQKIRVKRIS